jgi:hypothetical protein
VGVCATSPALKMARPTEARQRVPDFIFMDAPAVRIPPEAGS